MFAFGSTVKITSQDYTVKLEMQCPYGLLATNETAFTAERYATGSPSQATIGQTHTKAMLIIPLKLAMLNQLLHQHLCSEAHELYINLMYIQYMCLSKIRCVQ